MRRDSNLYTFIFALVVCMLCSLSISLVSEGLRSKKELNETIDIKKNILKAVNIATPISANIKADELLALYKENIDEIVIDGNGNVVEGLNPDDIKEDVDKYPLYVYRESGRVIAYCFPIVGKGLWSTIYGYFALESDAIKVRGITFYKHGETPGLGAEIEKNWFQDNFKGKSIRDLNDGKLTPITVIKGKVADVIKGNKAKFCVDGISGATMTSKGVTSMIDKWLNIYEPFFSRVKNNEE